MDIGHWTSRNYLNNLPPCSAIRLKCCKLSRWLPIKVIYVSYMCVWQYQTKMGRLNRLFAKQIQCSVANYGCVVQEPLKLDLDRQKWSQFPCSAISVKYCKLTLSSGSFHFVLTLTAETNLYWSLDIRLDFTSVLGLSAPKVDVESRTSLVFLTSICWERVLTFVKWSHKDWSTTDGGVESFDTCLLYTSDAADE